MELMSMSAIEIKDLSFVYPGQNEKLFDNFNLQISAGARFGIFGPNGAGKTTLMNLMTGLLPFEKGSIKIAGNEIRNKNKSVKKLFGFVPQDYSFYQELSPRENLEFFGAWSGMNENEIRNRTDELLTILDLTEVRNKPVAQFSGGMKRRVNLAIGVIHQPSILFLDEPTVGVDVQTRHSIINYLKLLNGKNTTLVYTSHQLSEAEELCDKVALIDYGKIIAHNDLDKLLAEYRHNGLEELFLNLTGKNFRNADV
jgi:ABC-2 type transport system ATP-binding protein